MIFIKKNELRILYKKIRKNIVEKDNKSLIITRKVLELSIFKSSKVVALYSNNADEVITKYLIDECFKQNKIVCLPKVLDDKNMEFYRIEAIEKLYLSSFNILEPNNDNVVNYQDIDIMIIPGIVFDKFKNRVGYGKGYYDNYLKNKNIYKAAICFDEQITDEEIIKNPLDVQMDLIITEENQF